MSDAIEFAFAMGALVLAAQLPVHLFHLLRVRRMRRDLAVQLRRDREQIRAEFQKAYAGVDDGHARNLAEMPEIGGERRD